ncbi:MAG: inorganic diphosphatase [Nitrospirales bacterium]|nr:inorganic diphosphatase [Nitrospirales bacterium]
MNEQEFFSLWQNFGFPCKSHPWHGVEIGEGAPFTVTAYIEIVPTDTVKYELDKKSGHLRVDRLALFQCMPHTVRINSSNLLWAIGRGTERRMHQSARPRWRPRSIRHLRPDGEKHYSWRRFATSHSNRWLRMIDGEEADDKIVAVLKGDALHEQWTDIKACPVHFVERLMHYFLTYKDAPGSQKKNCEITHVYGCEEAHEVIRRSQQDYAAKYGHIQAQLAKPRHALN